MSGLQIVSKNPIVRKIVEGSAKSDILEMLFGKQLPFTDEEYLESLVFAMKSEPKKGLALEMLKNVSDSTKSSYLDKKEANHRVAYYILLEAVGWKKSSIVGRAINNQHFPPEFLVKIAEKGDASMLEMLLENQIKLIAYPEIMETMEKNVSVTNYVLGRIKELRDYYLAIENAEEIAVADVLDDVKETLALEEKDKEQSADDEDDLDAIEDMDGLEGVEVKTLTALQEINNMTIAQRIKLALSGSKTERMILIKDNNKMVSLAVLESPKISLDEISVLSKNKSLPGEIIAKIARNRDWTKNYPIILELVKNPKTPIKFALSYIKQLHIRDLRQVTRNKNINPVIRNLAINFHDQKTGTRR